MSFSQLEDVEEIMRMASFISECGYRDLSKTQNRQCLYVARRLWREGVDDRILRLLRRFADSCGDNPVRLFCWWMDRPSRTLDKINEMRRNEKWLSRVLSEARETSAPPCGEVAPIYKLRGAQ